MTENSNQVADIASLGVVIGVLNNWLPVIAAFLAIIWTAIRIFEWFRYRIILKHPEPFK